MTRFAPFLPPHPHQPRPMRGEEALRSKKQFPSSDIVWLGEGTEVAGSRIGDQELRHTLQLPADLLDTARQRITVERDRHVRWRIEAIGCNHISIRGDHSSLTLHRDTGDAAYEIVEQNGCQHLRFSGRGRYELTMQLR